MIFDTKYAVVDENFKQTLCTREQLIALIVKSWNFHHGNPDFFRDLYPSIERTFVDQAEIKSEPITDVELRIYTETAGYEVEHEATNQLAWENSLRVEAALLRAAQV